MMLQVCRRLLQELSRHEGARCREHSQVTLGTVYCYLTHLSQLAVQHAVDMAARAGREALTAAVIQAEDWCELRRVSGKEELRREGCSYNYV